MNVQKMARLLSVPRHPIGIRQGTEAVTWVQHTPQGTVCLLTPTDSKSLESIEPFGSCRLIKANKIDGSIKGTSDRSALTPQGLTLLRDKLAESKRTLISGKKRGDLSGCITPEKFKDKGIREALACHFLNVWAETRGFQRNGIPGVFLSGPTNGLPEVGSATSLKELRLMFSSPAFIMGLKEDEYDTATGAIPDTVPEERRKEIRRKAKAAFLSHLILGFDAMGHSGANKEWSTTDDPGVIPEDDRVVFVVTRSGMWEVPLKDKNLANASTLGAIAKLTPIKSRGLYQSHQEFMLEAAEWLAKYDRVCHGPTSDGEEGNDQHPFFTILDDSLNLMGLADGIVDIDEPLPPHVPRPSGTPPKPWSSFHACLPGGDLLMDMFVGLTLTGATGEKKDNTPADHEG